LSTVGGGSDNVASGYVATVPGGSGNEAAGRYSLAAGHRAKALLPGCFVWGDETDHDVGCVAANQFVARAIGGVRFYSAVNAAGAPIAGVQLLPGMGAWDVYSDRTAKTNWRDVDSREVLDKLISIPIGEWSYRTQSDAIRHMGPSAQDFRAAFGLGNGDRTISTVDADGVALAAIQGLNRKLEQKVAALEAALQDLAAEIRALKSTRRD
jgi:Chaperone of endosialidase